MIKIGKSRITRTQDDSRLSADIQINEDIFTLYFMVDHIQEEYLSAGRADAFVLSVLPLAIREKHEIVCEEFISQRLCYQLNEYLIPALLFEMGEEHHIRIKAPFTAKSYPNQGAVGTLFLDDIDSFYTIMKHSKESEYPLTHVAVFNSGVFEGPYFRTVFQEKCSKAAAFARENGLKTIFVDTNFNEVLHDDFQSVCSFRNLACAISLQGLFSVYLMSAIYDAAQFKLDLENAARYDLLTVQCVTTESLSVYLFGSEVGYKKKLQVLQELNGLSKVPNWPHADAGMEGALTEKQEKEERCRDSINIGIPYIVQSNGRVSLCADVKIHGQEQVIWFSVKPSYGEFLTEDRADAFVVGLLTTAMREGMDIICKAPVTRRLLYQINNYLIPTMANNMQEYQHITVYAEPTDVELECAGAVGTGWTGGVDSMFTYMRHFQIEEEKYRLSHLLIANHGAIEGRTRETLQRMAEKTKKGFAEETGLDVVDVDTNLQEILPESFLFVGPFRHGAVVLALQKLFGIFLVSSTCTFSRFTLEDWRYEMITYKHFETDCTVLYNSGASFLRIQKLKELSDFLLARRYLHPCIYALKKNCGICGKCILAEVSFYAFGKLEQFSLVFDVEAFERNKYWYYRRILIQARNGDIAGRETVKILKQNVACIDALRELEQKKGDLISVIIPVYNAERYIHNCIQSIQEQSYPNIEVIIVDDGSTDSSREICEELCKSDPEIFFFKQEHRGVSAARNTGINMANGEYLFFLDSDDMIHPKLIETLFNLLKNTKAKMASEYYCREEEIFHNMCVDQTDEFCSHRYAYLSNQSMLREFLAYGEQGGIGGKMICRSVLYAKKFDENLINGEDTKFIYQLIIDGVDAVILYQDWYYYRKYEENLTKKQTAKARKSVYESMRYICDSEKERGRMINAINCEEHIIKWLIEGSLINQNGDYKTAEYLKRQIDAERKQEIFARIDRYLKLDTYLICCCYPIYNFKHRLADIYSKKKAARRMDSEDGFRKEYRKKNRNYAEKISVIISMYHSESCVRQCIQSVINQSYSNLEIIVIDDGSSDESLKISKKMESSDKRVHVYSRDNKGISAGRNFGLELATGKYVFFLNSNEAIHPLLLEELLWQAEDYHAGIVLCEYMDQNKKDMEMVLDRISEKDERPQWAIIEGTKSERWIYEKHYKSLMRVGVLICRESIGMIRFSETLFYGEDALFLYHVARKQNCIIYSVKKWYYRGLLSEEKMVENKNERYINFYRILRDEEYQRRYYDFSLIWERRIAWTLREGYMLMEDKDEQIRCLLKEQAFKEREHPMFKKLPLIAKTLFLCCFFFNPLYKILRNPVNILDKIVWTVGARINRKGDGR